ncbi:hypothetical protein M407DRAFT_33572 [Tulasnella calospora MUT 4182]|uniref:Uncharacterized protein n=1 Tax=Tulasnella calospora MUT 4182 TaxID=1051891 RepID=A0A0C3K5W6_9AGAM|nr:hypothetical protein M407DRAFT_33572 [Tulasnella calospora MUT 4182]
MFGTLVWIWASIVVLSVRGGPIPRSNPRKKCFTCPATDEAGFALGAALYTRDAPIYCQYPQAAMEEYHFFCLYSQLTGALVEDANDEGCPPAAEQTHCNPGKIISPQHSFMPDPSLENAWVNLAQRSASSGSVSGLFLRANVATSKRGGDPKQVIGDNIERSIEEAL